MRIRDVGVEKMDKWRFYEIRLRSTAFVLWVSHSSRKNNINNSFTHNFMVFTQIYGAFNNWQKNKIPINMGGFVTKSMSIR